MLDLRNKPTLTTSSLEAIQKGGAGLYQVEQGMFSGQSVRALYKFPESVPVG
jgi:hypothetical protein